MLNPPNRAFQSMRRLLALQALRRRTHAVGRFRRIQLPPAIANADLSILHCPALGERRPHSQLGSMSTCLAQRQAGATDSHLGEESRRIFEENEANYPYLGDCIAGFGISAPPATFFRRGAYYSYGASREDPPMGGRSKLASRSKPPLTRGTRTRRTTDAQGSH